MVCEVHLRLVEFLKNAKLGRGAQLVLLLHNVDRIEPERHPLRCRAPLLFRFKHTYQRLLHLFKLDHRRLMIMMLLIQLIVDRLLMPCFFIRRVVVDQRLVPVESLEPPLCLRLWLRRSLKV